MNQNMCTYIQHYSPCYISPSESTVENKPPLTCNSVVQVEGVFTQNKIKLGRVGCKGRF